jgi:cell division septum initiation protein DivIVA
VLAGSLIRFNTDQKLGISNSEFDAFLSDVQKSIEEVEEVLKKKELCKKMKNTSNFLESGEA